MKPSAIKGTCPGCWRKVAIIGNGVVPRHFGAPGARKPCPASGSTWTSARGEAAERAKREDSESDPASLPAQLRALVAADPRPDAEIARAAGMAPEALSRLLREDVPRDGRLSSYVRLAEALGYRLALVSV